MSNIIVVTQYIIQNGTPEEDMHHFHHSLLIHAFIYIFNKKNPDILQLCLLKKMTFTKYRSENVDELSALQSHMSILPTSPDADVTILPNQLILNIYC